MMSSVRRSLRLREKGMKSKSSVRVRRARERSGQSPSSILSESESSEEETVEPVKLIVTPSRSGKPRKPNDYTKVHSSYNRDYGLDIYERDFIDDSGTLHSTPRRSKGRLKQARRKRKRTLIALNSSDSDGGQSPNRNIIISSDEDTVETASMKQNANTSLPPDSSNSDDEVFKVGSKTNQRLPSSSEEEGIPELKKRRIVKELESDEEADFEDTPTRIPSSRAKKLRDAKEEKNARLFERFKAYRSGSVKSDCSHSSNNSSQNFYTIFSPNECTNVEMSLAERILFPRHANSEDSSEEDSDWIVSGSDSEYLDIKDVLKEMTLRDSCRKIRYHLEAESSIESLSDQEHSKPQDLPPLLLHEAVCGDGGVEALKTALASHNNPCSINAIDDKGYTALMCAADKGDNLSLNVLLEAGATINCKDNNGITPLHLASLSGWLECVETLVSHEHVVDCRDYRGWPPLLYAHFQDHQDCVIALMKAKPHQISVLGDLLKQTPQSGSDDSKKKTLKVVRSLLVSLAHHETYYSVFNDFIYHHPSVLEEDGFSFLKHCMGLLSFDNKQAWFQRKLKKLRDYANIRNYSGVSLSLRNVSRDKILDDILKQIGKCSEVLFWRGPLWVTFKGEAGTCTGPRKEFFSCLIKALVRDDEKLFCMCDDGQLSLQPCHLFYKHDYDIMNSEKLERHFKLLELVGMLIAHAVFHGEVIDLHLTNPMIKQMLCLPLDHPADLEAVDKSFYHGISSLLDETGNIEDLELTFTQTVLCPWSGRTVDYPLCEGGRTKIVTEENKTDFIEYLSMFKLEGCISHEIKKLLSGFWKVVPQKCLQVFTPSELTLLISGIPEIDVEDWHHNTKYCGLSESDNIIQWFWRLVRSLKQDEKCLLLKFSTGSPCVPAGGFASLQGLGGTMPFTITTIPGIDKVPQAATCFNTLKLTSYSNEQQLRNKVLIAIRYGCEGFEFS